MSDRGHLSIGEVLGLLQQEFPDVTISKIRFLESQGLLDPERTPSGYRKFYESDIDVLRWILVQQRDHFLPLRVIKERLDEAGPGTVPSDTSADEAAPVLGIAAPSAPAGPSAASPPTPPPTPPEQAPEPDVRLTSATDVPTPQRLPARSPIADLLEAPSAPAHSHPTSYTVAELALAAELSERDVRDLDGFGLLEGKVVGGERTYDGDAVEVARLCAGLLRAGLEVRHLRMYKTAADREVTTYEQLLSPLLRQRNSEARARGVDRLRSLAAVGKELRQALVDAQVERTIG